MIVLPVNSGHSMHTRDGLGHNGDHWPTNQLNQCPLEQGHCFDRVYLPQPDADMICNPFD